MEYRITVQAADAQQKKDGEALNTLPKNKTLRDTQEEQKETAFPFTSTVAKLAPVAFQSARISFDLVARDTGNRQISEQVSAVTSAIGTAGAIAGAFAAGGIVGGAVATVMVGLNFFKKLSDFNYDREWESIALEQMRNRAGPSYNQSR